MNDHDEILQPLEKQGWAISDTVVPLSWYINFFTQGWHLWETGHFYMEGIGRNASDAWRPDIRGDTICRIYPNSPQANHPFFRWVAQFREELKERYHLGLRSQEFHFAHYGKGKG